MPSAAQAPAQGSQAHAGHPGLRTMLLVGVMKGCLTPRPRPPFSISQGRVCRFCFFFSQGHTTPFGVEVQPLGVFPSISGGRIFTGALTATP
jgi:hypothetical protein